MFNIELVEGRKYESDRKLKPSIMQAMLLENEIAFYWKTNFQREAGHNDA